MNHKFKYWLEQQDYSIIDVWGDYNYRKTLMLYKVRKQLKESKGMREQTARFKLNDIIKHDLTSGWTADVQIMNYILAQTNNGYEE